MIRTSRQLKALVRNLSKGDSTKAQIIIRNYVMERFLERLSISQYRDNLILKGGTLVAAMVGLGNRSTLDVDATVKNLSLTEESARSFVEGEFSRFFNGKENERIPGSRTEERYDTDDWKLEFI